MTARRERSSADGRPIAVDLFAGVGGMSLGVRAAGFHVAGAVELDPIHVETYNRNFGENAAVAGDLSAMSGEEIRQKFSLEGVPISLLFGGPPCQGFSVGGVRQAEDPRNELLGHFARLVLELRPQMFIAENVAGLMSPKMRHHLESFLLQLTKGGYQVADPVQILSANDFGVPQRRKRVIVMGSQPGIALPTYPETGQNGAVTVADAIADLPDVDAIEELFELDVYSGKLGKKSKYVKSLDEVFSGLGADGSKKPDGLSGCRRTAHSDKSSTRFGATAPGTADSVSRFYRLALDGQAPTLRAGTDSSRGSYTAPRPIHPTAPRCITVREAARLHSYPDWFQFAGAKWHAFRQIGNSVPPLLAKAVAQKALETLND